MASVAIKDNKQYLVKNICNVQGSVKINQVLPFKVRFKNIGIPAYSSSNVPPIGIAIIGYNNYIL